MMNFAHVTLTANTGPISKTKDFGDNRKLGQFQAAVNRRFTRQGETVEETDWYTVKTSNPMLINLIEKLNKGQRLTIMGRLEVKKFDRNDGSEGTSVEVWADHIYYADAKRAEDTNGEAARSEKSRANGKAKQPAQSFDVDDEIPF
jgi:single-strand DNA-binding protein